MTRVTESGSYWTDPLRLDEKLCREVGNLEQLLAQVRSQLAKSGMWEYRDELRREREKLKARLVGVRTALCYLHGWEPSEHAGSTGRAHFYALARLKQLSESEQRRCPDGGTCHHNGHNDCATTCWRTQHAGPLSGVYPGDRWPAEPAPGVTADDDEKQG
jgi:hypothetical protein